MLWGGSIKEENIRRREGGLTSTFSSKEVGLVQIDAHARTKVAETHLFSLHVLILQPFCAVAVADTGKVCVGGGLNTYMILKDGNLPLI